MGERRERDRERLFLYRNDTVSVMLNPTVTAVGKPHSCLPGAFLNLEYKLTSCDLKYKRSLLTQIRVEETLAKLVSAWGSVGTPARKGWRPLCCLLPEDGSALSFLKAVYSGHHVPRAVTSPSPGISCPSRPHAPTSPRPSCWNRADYQQGSQEKTAPPYFS